MKNILYIALLPLLIYAQNNTSISNISSKKLIFSFQCGTKIYSGNRLLDNRTFTREGVFFDFNFSTNKEITKKVNIISRSSLSLSNAVAKEIDISIPETDIDFVTKIPNILACNINYSITINKQINKYLSHGASLNLRVFPLFYKKGHILNNEPHSLGGFISSEENGSLPDLEKATQMSYNINYWFNNLTSMSVLFFVNSDWSINHSEIRTLYPGLSIQFEQTIDQNFQPPWVRKLNK